MNSPKVLASFAHELEAGVIVNELRSRGIRAQTSGETLAGFRAEVPGDVNVLVPEEQLELARRHLEELHSTTRSDVNWSLVDVGDPVEPDVTSPVQRNQVLLWGLLLATAIFFAGLLVKAIGP